MSDINKTDEQKLNSRPKKNRTRQIHIRLTEDDYIQLKLKAKASNLTVTDYIIRTAFDERFNIIFTDYKSIQEIRLLHADLNRLGNFMVSRRAKEFLGIDGAYSVKKACEDTIELTHTIIELIRHMIRTIGNKDFSNFD